MTFSKHVLWIPIALFLMGCSNEMESKNPSSEGGLPQSQRTQENSPAGVKFNEKTPFKSLSDSPESKR